jgi:hypothetical protein
VSLNILFGDEDAPETPNNELSQRLQWAAIDPRRHVLYVWQKSVEANCQDVVVTLGASAFSNGPFNLYEGKTPGPTAHLVYWGGLISIVPILSIFGAWALKNKWKKFIFGNVTPEGFILGKREGINDTANSRPQHHYFGRKSGTDFASYEIARGDRPRVWPR